MAPDVDMRQVDGRIVLTARLASLTRETNFNMAKSVTAFERS